MIRCHIRWMIGRDMPEVLAIELASFAGGWTRDDFVAALRAKNCIGMVAEVGDRVVGYMVYTLEKDRLTILNFAVEPAYRRQDIGTQMALKLAAKLSSHRRTHLLLHCRESNLAAHLFWRSCGFRAVEVCRDWHDDEDAYLFRFDLKLGPPAEWIPEGMEAFR